jgi:hypothetical protein
MTGHVLLQTRKLRESFHVNLGFSGAGAMGEALSRGLISAEFMRRTTSRCSMSMRRAFNRSPHRWVRARLRRRSMHAQTLKRLWSR